MIIKEPCQYQKPHLKRQPNCCFVNNYLNAVPKAWQANMGIQPVFNEYKAVTCMCQNFSKTEDQCSQDQVEDSGMQV